MLVGTHQIGNVGSFPALFVENDRGHLVADTLTTLRWVAGVNHQGVGARPESAEFILACEREQAAGNIENRRQSKLDLDAWWITDAGRDAQAST